MFLLATVNYKPLYLDKSRSFTTSMDARMRPPMLLFYARLRGIIIDSYRNTLSSLITKENISSGLHHIIEWKIYSKTELDEFTIETHQGLTEEVLEYANGEYYPDGHSRG